MGTLIFGMFDAGEQINSHIDRIESIRSKYDREDDEFKISEDYLIRRKPSDLGVNTRYTFERNGKPIFYTDTGIGASLLNGVKNDITLGISDSCVFLVKDPRVNNIETLKEVEKLTKEYIEKYQKECESKPLGY